MEHSPEVIKHCVLEFFAEFKHRRSLIDWRREELSLAEEGMDAIQSARIGCELDVQGYRDKTNEAYMILNKKREEFAFAIAENLSWINEAWKICNKEDRDIYAVWLHYVDGLRWHDISYRLGYSVSHLKTNVAPKGLKKIYEKMPEEFRRYTIPDSI